MQVVESWLRTVCALLLIFHNSLCNVHFSKPASFVSEEVEIHWKISVSCTAASIPQIGRIRQLRDDPGHWKSTPSQYLNTEPVVGNLRQQVFYWGKKNNISSLARRCGLLKRPQHSVLGADCLIRGIWREFTFSMIASSVDLFLQEKEIVPD